VTVHRRLGDLELFPLGMGAMTLTQVEGVDEARATRAVHAALDAGIRLFDTADVYGPIGAYGINELALTKALRSWSGSLDDVVVATKGGHTRDGLTWWIDGSAEHLAKACRDSLRRLGVDSISLYQHHRPDPRRPYAESMEALKKLHDEGLVQRVGISNAGVEQIRAAVDILGPALVSVQNELSPLVREHLPEVALCEELGLAFLAYSPFGGMREAKALGSQVADFAAVAEDRGVSPQQVALAWLLAISPCVIPIPGASRPESVLDSVRGVDLVLDPEELARLQGSVDSHI